MRLLVVVHNFLPNHAAGGELYAYRLAKELASRHEILVLATDQALFRRNYSRREYTHDGLPVIEVTNHRRYGEFSDSYADRVMEAHFKRVLQEFAPDLVHFQHLLHHSVAYPEIARESGIPSVMTLHEYWLLCARNGQMIQADDERCERPGLDKCSSCVSSFMWGRKSVDVWVLRGIAALKTVTGVDLRARARQIRLAQKGQGTPTDDATPMAMRKLLLLREARMRDLFSMVDMFIAPSQWLKRRFVEFDFEPERILHSDYGTPLESFTRAPLRREGPLRIGYLSSMQHVKGAHVLLDALARLDPKTFVATLHGDMSHKPEYVRRLRDARPESVKILGALTPQRVPAVLNGFDVLVVPSIWWENSPLVIHEAFASGVPVVCSGIGGMAELVADGQSGLHFRPDDAADLAAKLRALIDDRDLLHRLRDGIPKLRTIEEDADFHDELFEAVLNSYA